MEGHSLYMRHRSEHDGLRSIWSRLDVITKDARIIYANWKFLSAGLGMSINASFSMRNQEGDRPDQYLRP